MSNSNNKIIAKNAVMLYGRMLLSIVVTLYTSRVVLQTLGVDDFGIYGVVGGVVSLFSFLNASMSGATSRFITFSIGQGDINRVRDTFSTALIIHLGIALCIIILSETIGLWFLENKLVIPDERMSAARIVYQFSIVAMAVQVIQVPYNASIISHERMDVYAYVELFNVFLKLGIVYLIKVGDFDKLILYAALVLVVHIVVACTYRIFCIRHFDTCKFRWVIDKSLLMPMLSFSGWDLYGNMCYSVRQQGLNMLINMFFGVALNAASSIATSVQGVVSSLSANVIQAFRPQIIKQYAQGRILEMESLMCNSVKFSVLMFSLIGVPLAYEMEPIMNLWLGTVPEYACQFCRVLMLISLFNLINSVLGIAIHATGRIKLISIVSGTIYLLTIPIVYILFRFLTTNPLASYITSLIIMILVVFSNMIIVKIQIPIFSIKHLYRSLATAFVLAISASPSLLISNLVDDGIFHIIVSFLTYISMLSILTYFIALDKETRDKVNQFVLSKLNVFYKK